ncbi:hypothetical protein HZS_7146 [Henneguya salminicola]|nr:hypothetical protein HZS_7146 [Henneguya salminicola]
MYRYPINDGTFFETLILPHQEIFKLAYFWLFGSKSKQMITSTKHSNIVWNHGQYRWVETRKNIYNRLHPRYARAYFRVVEQTPGRKIFRKNGNDVIVNITYSYTFRFNRYYRCFRNYLNLDNYYALPLHFKIL